MTIDCRNRVMGELMAPRNVHTTPNPQGNGWVNSVGGNSAGVVHRTQEAAIDAGRRIAEQNQAEHFIHGRNGQVRDKNSYGNDPFPPKG